MKKSLLLLSFLLLILRGVTTAQNPYESLGKVAPVLTLSEGKYQEFMTNDTIVRIGSVMFNTITKEVVSFLDEDTLRVMDADMSTRFLSVDPIGRKYPELTPYQFASNRPIDGIDLDGLEWLSAGYVYHTIPVCTTNGEVYQISIFGSKTIHTATEKKNINGTDFYNIGKHLYNQGFFVTEDGSREFQLTVGSIIGKQLTSNIENLLRYPGDLPEVGHEPKDTKATAETANKYQNSGGVCFYSCLLRLNKAFGNAMKFSSADLSNGASSNKNDEYIGYGAGSVLIHKGLGSPVTDEEVWAGKLQEGALLQWWKDPKGGTDKPVDSEVMSALRRGAQVTGHSVIFKDYIYKDGKIEGFIFYDTHGIEHTNTDSAGERQNKRIYGTNLKQ